MIISARMQKAAFKIAIGTSVDNAGEIVTGCRLAEVNRQAVFSGSDGKPVTLNVTAKLIDDLLGLATQQGRLDAYWTHDRLNKANADKDAIHDSVGVWRNFRKDESGNLIADFQAEPSPFKEKILWKAQHDPNGIMCSMVFGYEGSGDNVRAIQLESADFVRFGAATTALLSAYPTENKSMTIEELLAMLQDPAVRGVIATMIKEADKAEDSTEADAAAMEVEYGVMEEDKKPEDEQKPAIMRAIARGNRAFERKKAAILSEVKNIAKAEATALLGRGGIPTVKTGATDEETPDKFITAKLASGEAKNRALAIAMMGKQRPDLYQKHITRS